MDKALINMMAKCDGTKKNCEGCAFAEHPECRNAMNRHGAAVLNLTTVMLENSREISTAAIARRKEAEQTIEAQARALGMFEEMSGNIAQALWEQKHCPTCQNNPEDIEMSEICRKCQSGESEWLMAKRLMPRVPGEETGKEPEAAGEAAEEAVKADGPVMEGVGPTEQGDED